MRKLLILSLLSIFFIQDFPGYKILGKIESDNNYFSTDPLGNVYLINKNIISRYNKDGSFENSFSNSISGNISFADLSDPLRIMLYFSDFNQLIFLDNTLSRIGDYVSLDDYGFDLVSTVCTSANGGIWLYDQKKEAVVYLDRNMKIKQQTPRISNIIDFIEEPDFMLEKDNKVFLNIPGAGIVIFDNFGSYLKCLALKNINEFQVFEEQIVYYIDKKLQLYNFNNNTEKNIDLPSFSQLRQVRLEQKIIYLSGDQAVYIIEKNK